MAAAPVFIGTPQSWPAQVSVANTGRDGSGTLVDVVTGAANGSRIDRVRFTAQGTTTAGVVRLFKTNAAGSTTRFVDEVLVDPKAPSTTVKAWQYEFDFPFGFILVSGEKLKASTHNAEIFDLVAFGGDF